MKVLFESFSRQWSAEYLGFRVLDCWGFGFVLLTLSMNEDRFQTLGVCVVRDAISSARVLCKAFPEGPSTQ